MMRKLQWNGVAGGDGINNGSNSIFNRFLGTVLLFVVMTGSMFAQYSISGVGSTNTYIQNFDAFRGSAATMPTNWAYSGTLSSTVITAGTTTFSAASANSLFSARPNSTSTDYSGVGKVSGTGSTTWTFTTTNATGAAINGFEITWNAEIFSKAGRAPSLDFDYKVGAAAYSSANISGTTLTTNTTGTDAIVAVDAVITTPRSISITGLTIPNGTTVIFRFTITGGGGSGNNSHIGVDDFTMYATTSTPTYTLTYNGNSNTGGTVPTDPSSPYTATSTVTVLGNTGTLTRTGYNFSGWNTAAAGNGTDRAAASTFSMPASNTILYAKWTGNVSYNANGGTGTVTDATNYLAGQSVTTASGAGFTRAGYAFIGWNTLANGLGTSYTASQVSAFNFAGNTTLYAVWNPVGSHTVIFEANGGTGTMANQVESSAAALTTNAFTRTGYTFANWNSAANGSGTTYTNGQTYSFASNITLYAQWTANNNTVTFDANTGTGTMSSQTIATAATVALNANTFTKAGYTFAGWATTAGGAVAYTNSASYTMGTSNVTLYAKWTANNNTITFDGNGSTSGTMANQTIATDASATLTSNTFVRTGFTFAGWATSAVGAVAYADGATYNMGTSSVTLYAVWDVYTGPCLSENFDGTVTGWTFSGTGDFQSCSGASAIGFDSNGDSAISPVVNSPTSLTFNTKRASNSTAWTMFVQISTDATYTTWSTVATLTIADIGTTCATYGPIDLSSYTGARKIRFLDQRATGGNQRAIDDVIVYCAPACSTPTDPNGTIVATQNCGNTSLAYTHGSGQPVAGVSYYWQTTATGEDTTHPTSSPFVATTGGTYHVRAKSTVGNCWSAGTVSQAVTVVLANAITTEPTNQTVPAGTTATFTVVATNATSYQWQVNTGSSWSNVSTGTGGTTASYTTPTTTLAMSGYQYKVIVSGTSPCVAIESAVRTLTISPVITYANLQFPGSHTMEEGSTVAVYGRVYAESVTEAAGASGTITAEFGYSTTNSNPNTWTNWTTGTFNIQVGNDDEYTASLGTGLTPGTYYYATRFRIASGAYVYGGTAGIWSSTANNGVLTVTSNLVDWGNYQHPATGTITLGDNYNVYGQVYEAGNTEAGGQGGNITAEVGYSTTNNNPNTWTNWFPANFNTDAGNNDEYIRNIGPNFPAGATYYLAFRYRKTGSTQYVYGGTNGVWNNDNATVTVLSPKEINIRQGATDIASNGTYAFGNQVVTTSSTAITFTIQNTGGVVLNLSGTPRVAITGSNASEFTINQATLPATVAPNSSETFTVIFTPTSLGAKTALLSIANDDSDENPYLITLTGTGTASATSNIIANAGFINSPINYLNYINSNITAANSFELGQFIIQDGGGSPDADNLGTTLSTLSLMVGNVAYLERIALYDGTTEIAELAASASTVFTGLSLTANDGGTKIFSIRASFKTAVTDNQRIIVTISGATAAASGSTFGSISASTSSAGLTDNVIQVTADRLAFVQQPSNTSINVAMAPAVTVSANDINGNRDVDHVGNVNITSTGTLTGSPVIVAFSSGLASFPTLTHTVAQTGRTLSATSTGLTGANSSLFNITTIVYVDGDWKSTSSGNWSSTASGSTVTWSRRVSGAWVPQTLPTQPPTSGSANTVYIYTDVTLVGNNTAKDIIIGVDPLDSTKIGILHVGISSTFGKLVVEDGGTFSKEANGVGFDSEASGGLFEVKNGGTFIFRHTNTASRSTTIWNGKEKFHPNSIFKIVTVDASAMTVIQAVNDISTHTEDGTTACFGNIIVDCSTGKMNLVPSGFNLQLTAKDLIFRNNSDTTPLSTGNITTTIGGDLIIESTYAQTINFASTASTINITVKGNFIHNGTRAFRPTTNLDANSTFTIEGDLSVNNGGSFLMNGASGAITGTSVVNLKGDLTISSTSLLNSTASGNHNFNFTGNGDGLTAISTQTIDALPTIGTNINFNITSGTSPVRNAYVRLINQSLSLGTASKLIVENGATLDFGFSPSNNPLIVTGPSFESKTGSTLKITSGDGITSSGATGNVQVTAANRTFASDANYEYIGITTPQNTGNALPSSVRNLVINNTATNADVVLTNDVIVTSGLTMTQGNINGITNTKTITLGTSALNTGTLLPTTPTGFVKGTMARWFSSATTTGNAGLFPLGTNETSSKNRHAKIDYSTAPTGGKLTASILTGTPTLVSPYLIIDAVGSCNGFLTQTVEDFNWRLTPSDGLANGKFTGAFTKEGTAISNTCEVTLIRKNPTVWEAPTIIAATQGTVTKFTVSRTELNAFGDFGIAHKDNCIGTKTWTGTQWESTPGVATTAPTITERAVIDGNYDTTTHGALTACSCTVKTDEEVVIHPAHPVTLLEGFTNTTGYEGIISIKNDATLLQLIDVKNATANNNTGKIDMERITKPMYRYDFSYWSSPVFANNDQSDDSTSVANGAEFNLRKLSPMTMFDKYYKWNHAAATPAWVTIPLGAESMVPGRGYIVRAPQNYGATPVPASYQPYTANFIGVPNNGIVEHAVSGADKWNLIGNPYPSAISADAFFDANVGPGNGSTNTLEGTLYLWTHNTKILPTGVPHIYSYSAADYAAYNGTGSTDTKEADSDPTPADPDDNKPTGFIAAGQSFFIKGTANGQAVFNNAMRVAGNNSQFFRPGTSEPLNDWNITGKHRIWLNMKGQTVGFNQLLVGYIENATNDWDIRFDGESFGGNQVTFYSLLADKKLTIQGRALPFNNQDEVPLGYKTTLNGTLTIRIDDYDGLFEGQDIYLEDKLLNIVHDLKASAYSFTTVSGTFNGRFVLRYLPSEQLGNPGPVAVADGLILYQEDDKIMIKSQLQALEQVTIYDLLGRTLFNTAGIGQNEIRIENVVMNEQPLIVKIRLANGQIVNKKIVY